MAHSAEDKVLEIPMSGMDQSEDEFASTKPFWLTENVRIRGGVLRKRPGTATVAHASTTDTQEKLAGDGTVEYQEKTSWLSVVGKSPAVGSSNGLVLVKQRSDETDKFVFAGHQSTCKPIQEIPCITGYENDFSISFPPCCAVDHNDNVLIAQPEEGSGDLHIRIMSPNGSAIWTYHANLTAGIRVKAISVTDFGTANKKFLVVYQNGGSTTLTAMVVSVDDDGDVTIDTAPASVATLTASTSDWDIAELNAHADVEWGLIFVSASTNAVVQRFDLALTSDGATNETVVAGSPVSIWGDTRTGYIWVSYLVSTNVVYRILHATGGGSISSILAATTITGGTTANSGAALFGQHYEHDKKSDDEAAFFVIRRYDSTSELVQCYFGRANDDGLDGVNVGAYHFIPVTKPDNYNRAWCYVSPRMDDVTIKARYALVRFHWDSDTIGSRNLNFCIELASSQFEAHDVTVATKLNTFWNIGIASDAYYFVWDNVLTTQDDSIVGTQVRSQIVLYKYDALEHTPQQDVAPVGSMLVTAGQPTQFPGLPWSVLRHDNSTNFRNLGGGKEIGFVHAPALVEASDTTGDITPGTRRYRAVYEWVDTLGQRHRSAPSVPIEVTNTVDRSFFITPSMLSLSQANGNDTPLKGRIYIYRTVDAGETYHKLDDTGTEAIGTLASNFDDNQTDSDIEDNEILYTDGGTLANDLAPSCQFMMLSEQRLWLGGLWRPELIQASKLIIPEEPVQFTDDRSHQVVLPGACTGLSYMDGSVIAFTKFAIYSIVGEGPDARGAGGFSGPRAIVEGVGCVDWRSVVETPAGVMFLGLNGFYLLPRGLGSPIFEGVGSMVRAVLEAGLPDCVDSAFLTDGQHSLARFALSSSGGTTYTKIVTYDIESNFWSVDELATPATGYSALGTWPNAFAYGNAVLSSDEASDGYPILFDHTGQSDDEDSTSSVVQKVKTAWLSPFGSGGYGQLNKVMVVFRALGNVRLIVKVYSEDGATQTGTWDVVAGSDPMHYRAINLKANKGTRWQVEAYAAPYEGTGDAISVVRFTSLVFEHEKSGSIRYLTNGERI